MLYDLTPEIPDAVLALMNVFDVPVYIIGGAVRDLVALAEDVNGFSLPTDWDLEVYADSPKDVQCVLTNCGYSFKITGNHFPVFKVNTTSGVVDIALPRAETNTGPGHKDFEVKILSHDDRKLACQRRDFTINAMMYNPKTFELYDPFNGRNDLIERVLRITDEGTFGEDPLRVLRAAKFLSRFGFEFDDWAKDWVCQDISLDSLPKERIYWEMVDMLRDGAKPSLGLRFLEETRQLYKLFPELGNLVEVPQDPKHHPEGDAFTHTCLVADQACKLRLPLHLKFAALAHDLGKATNTVKRRIGGQYKWTSYGHDEAGVPLAESFMLRFTDDADLIKKVCEVTRYHMAFFLMMKRFVPANVENISDKQLRKLAAKLDSITMTDLVDFARADRLGRKWISGETPHIDTSLTHFALTDRLNALAIKDKPEPKIVTGKMLLGMGIEPGRYMGNVIDLAYEAQLDGEFSTEEQGKAWASKLIKERTDNAVPDGD